MYSVDEQMRRISMRCQSCGGTFNGTAAVCPMCQGPTRPPVCPDCGTVIIDGACRKCGYPTAEAKAPPPEE